MAYIIGSNIDTRRLSFPTTRRSDPWFNRQPTPQMPDDDDWSRQVYVEQIYGGPVSNQPEAQKAILDQYDYNKKRVLSGKDPLKIADVKWNPSAYDDSMNEWMYQHYRKTGTLPSGEERLDHFQVQDAKKLREAFEGPAEPATPQASSTTAPVPHPAGDPLASSKSSKQLDDAQDFQAYIDKVYGGSVSPRPEVQQAIAKQFDYNIRRVLSKKEPLEVADVRWDPTGYDDDTNEALERWQRDKGSLPSLTQMDEFELMLREYRNQKAAAAQRQGLQEPSPSGVSQQAGNKALDQEAQSPTTTELINTQKQDDLTSIDLLQGILDPDQFEYLRSLDDQIYNTLTDQQRQKIQSGEDTLASIFSWLDDGQQQKIGQLNQAMMDSLTPDQKADLLFLSSGIFDTTGLEKRRVVLDALKKNSGTITYDELIRLGVQQQAAPGKNIFDKMLQTLALDGPKRYHELLEEDYRLSKLNTSLYQLNQEQRVQQIHQLSDLLTMAAAPLLDRRNYGSSNVAFGDNVYDNIEKYGAQGNFKGFAGKYSELPPGISAKAGEPALGLDDAAQKGTPRSGNQERTRPIQEPNPNAIPKGLKTKISIKDDSETTRSLTRENESADIMAVNGYDVEQNPKVDGLKKPDYKINGEIFDNFAPYGETNPRNIWSAVRKKVNQMQTERIVLNLSDWNGSVTELKTQFRDWPITDLKEVIVIDKNRSIFHLFP